MGVEDAQTDLTVEEVGTSVKQWSIFAFLAQSLYCSETFCWGILRIRNMKTSQLSRNTGARRHEEEANSERILESSIVPTNFCTPACCPSPFP